MGKLFKEWSQVAQDKPMGIIGLILVELFLEVAIKHINRFLLLTSCSCPTSHELCLPKA
jgi:hypothetical protein